MKVSLLQLPVQSHDYQYSQENVPLALGYLKAFGAPRLTDTEITISEPEIVNLGGDSAIVHWLEQQRPDVIGFGCALWNIQRTLYLCSQLKERLPKLLLVLGGPEITADNPYILDNGVFDVGVVGEGEESFCELLATLEQGRKEFSHIPGIFWRQAQHWVVNAPRPPIPNLDVIPSPYLQGIIRPSRLGTMVIETLRGCPYRCTYCYYHKSYPQVRTFSLSRIAAEIRYAMEHGVHDVYFLDPCFARRPDLPALLQIIQQENRTGRLGIFCELNAEDLTAVLVEELAKAGVKQAEIGLQTINPQTLKTVKRRFQKDALIKGIGMLRSQGITVALDIMVGLPGDRLEDVQRTIDFAVDNGIYDELNIYPLSVLPGTKLRQMAQELGILYRQEPPYLVLQTKEMGVEDIYQAFLYGEAVTEIDFFPVELPATQEANHTRGLISQIIVPSCAVATLGVKPETIGQSLTIAIEDATWEEKWPSLSQLLVPLLKANPFVLVDWVLPYPSFPSLQTLRAMIAVSLRLEHPINHEYFAAYAPIRSVQVFLAPPQRGDGCDDGGMAWMAKIPLEDETLPANIFPFWQEQRTFWIAFDQEIPPEAEGHYLTLAAEILHCRPEEIRLGELTKS